MLHVAFEKFPDLATTRLGLRELRQSDATTLFALRSHPDVLAQLHRNADANVTAVEQLIETLQANYLAGESVHWVLTRRGSEELIGSILLWRIDKQNHRAELGYILHPDYWRQGFMSEAMETVLRFGFETMKLHSIEASTSATNIASQKLLLKNGFTREAHFRESWFFNGRYLDSLVFCKLAPK